mgnify:FL=1
MSNLKRMSSFKLEKTIENDILFINQSITQYGCTWPTLDEEILPSEKFHTSWFYRWISWFYLSLDIFDKAEILTNLPPL